MAYWLGASVICKSATHTGIHCKTLQRTLQHTMTWLIHCRIEHARWSCHWGSPAERTWSLLWPMVLTHNHTHTHTHSRTHTRTHTHDHGRWSSNWGPPAQRTSSLLWPKILNLWRQLLGRLPSLLSLTPLLVSLCLLIIILSYMSIILYNYDHHSLHWWYDIIMDATTGETGCVRVGGLCVCACVCASIFTCVYGGITVHLNV